MIKIFTLAAALLSATLAYAQQSPLPARQERGNLILDGIPARDAALAGQLGRYLNSRSAEFLDWLPDGGLLVATRFGDTQQVHRVAAPLGMREQLTFYAEPVSTARAPQTANAEGFVFLKNPGGGENAQLYYYRNADRSVRLLTDGKSLDGDPVWSHDGRRFAYYSNGRDGVGYDIYVADIAANAAPRLVVGAQKDMWRPLDWSADDQKLLAQRDISNGASDLLIVDAWSGIITPLTTPDRKISFTAAKFAPDGRGVIVTSKDNSEFAQLLYIDSTTHESRKLTPDRNGDIAAFDTSDDGRYLAYIRNEEGRSRLTVLDNQTKIELLPPNVPDGRIAELRFDRAGKRLAFSAESAQSPRDVYVYDLARNALERWTRSEAGPVDSNSFVMPELVHYPSWDRRSIAAYVYRPRSAGPHPVLIHLPGNAEGQYQAGFEPFFQFLANELGIAVIAPNVRGSSDILRDGAVKDVGSLLVWTGLQSAFDRERVFVMGESYGGSLALASLAAYSDRLRGGIDFVSVPQFAQLKNAVAMRRPLLVAQGMNDPRVPAAESQQIVSVLRSRGGEVWYLAAKDEGRSFRNKSNRDAYYETVAAFLERLTKR